MCTVRKKHLGCEETYSDSILNLIPDREQKNYPSISVPTPKGLPRIARSAPSPPEEPPGVSFLLYGFVVRPNTLLCVSPHYAVERCQIRCSCVSPTTSMSVNGRTKGTHHECLWYISTNKWHRSEFVQDFHKDTVILCKLPNVTSVS